MQLIEAGTLRAARSEMQGIVRKGRMYSIASDRCTTWTNQQPRLAKKQLPPRNSWGLKGPDWKPFLRMHDNYD